MGVADDPRSFKSRADATVARYVTGYGETLSTIMAMLQGALPEVNYNEIRRTLISQASVLFVFYWNSSKQFGIRITNPYDNLTAIIEKYYAIAKESDGDNVLLEDGSLLLTEEAP
jgi:hypothetical protein